VGRSGEALARARLERDGYEILDRNWRSGRYELDLVASRGGVVAFVEVKTRRPGPQRAVEALDPTQRLRIRRAAESWIHAHPGVGREFRFDLVTVDVARGGPARVEHIPDAFHGDD
jgi:putative endonuclease